MDEAFYTDSDLLASADTTFAFMGISQLSFLRKLAQCDKAGLYRHDDCRDTAQWMSLRYGVSEYIARKWLRAAHAIEGLPTIRGALAAGRLSLDKALELCRFATPEDEERWLRWALRVSRSAIKAKADEFDFPPKEEVRNDERCRSVELWPLESGTMMQLSALMPIEEGVAVANALDDKARSLPDSPEDGSDNMAAKRADALVAFVLGDRSSGSSRPTLVVHAELDTLTGRTERAGRIEGGGFLDPDVLRQLACDCNFDLILWDDERVNCGIGRRSRSTPEKIERALRHRDGFCCTFPGCNNRAYLNSHHIQFWELGGVTNMNNLTTVCHFHHKLIHKFGWRVALGDDGITRWFRPDGAPYRAGPAPPREPALIA